MTDETATAAPEVHVDWTLIAAAAGAYAAVRKAHPSGALMDAAETLAFLNARDNFRRVVTPEAIQQLLSMVPGPSAGTIDALQNAADTMERSADEIRHVLSSERTGAGRSLEPWLRHTVSPRTGQPCLVGSRDDDGDHPQQCICGLAEALLKVGL